MATKNSVTGDEIKSKALSSEGRARFDKIFRKQRKFDIFIKENKVGESIARSHEEAKFRALEEGLIKADDYPFAVAREN